MNNIWHTLIYPNIIDNRVSAANAAPYFNIYKAVKSVTAWPGRSFLVILESGGEGLPIESYSLITKS